jgi:hypothetical protein
MVVMPKKGAAGAVSDEKSLEDPHDQAFRPFSNQVVTNLCHSLPEPVCERRRELLPKILCEWSTTDLPKHLSLDTRAAAKERMKKVEQVRDCARALLQALNAADEEQATIVHEMLLRVEGRSLQDVSRLE